MYQYLPDANVVGDKIKYLDGNLEETRKILKKILLSSYLGNDVTCYFPEVSKYLLVSNDLMIKKHALSYVQQNSENPQNVLMVINTLNQLSKDANPMFRALVIKTITTMNQEFLKDHSFSIVKAGLHDESAQVRRAAVLGCLKLHRKGDQRILEAETIDKLYGMIRDEDPLVILNALRALDIILESEGGVTVNRNMVMFLAQKINLFKDINLYTLIHFIVKYKPKSAEEVLKLMNCLDTCLLQSYNPSALLLTISLILCWVSEYLPHLRSQVFLRSKDSMLHIFTNDFPEQTYALLNSSLNIFTDFKENIQSSFEYFLAKPEEHNYLKIKKLQILPILINHCNHDEIIEYLHIFSRQETAVTVIRQIIKTLLKIYKENEINFEHGWKLSKTNRNIVEGVNDSEQIADDNIIVEINKINENSMDIVNDNNLVNSVNFFQVDKKINQYDLNSVGEDNNFFKDIISITKNDYSKNKKDYLFNNNYSSNNNSYLSNEYDMNLFDDSSGLSLNYEQETFNKLPKVFNNLKEPLKYSAKGKKKYIEIIINILNDKGHSSDEIIIEILDFFFDVSINFHRDSNDTNIIAFILKLAMSFVQIGIERYPIRLIESAMSIIIKLACVKKDNNNNKDRNNKSKANDFLVNLFFKNKNEIERNNLLKKKTESNNNLLNIDNLFGENCSIDVNKQSNLDDTYLKLDDQQIKINPDYDKADNDYDKTDNDYDNMTDQLKNRNLKFNDKNDKYSNIDKQLLNDSARNDIKFKTDDNSNNDISLSKDDNSKLNYQENNNINLSVGNEINDDHLELNDLLKIDNSLKFNNSLTFSNLENESIMTSPIEIENNQIVHIVENNLKDILNSKENIGSISTNIYIYDKISYAIESLLDQIEELFENTNYFSFSNSNGQSHKSDEYFNTLNQSINTTEKESKESLLISDMSSFRFIKENSKSNIIQESQLTLTPHSNYFLKSNLNEKIGPVLDDVSSSKNSNSSFSLDKKLILFLKILLKSISKLFLVQPAKFQCILGRILEICYKSNEPILISNSNLFYNLIQSDFNKFQYLIQ